MIEGRGGRIGPGRRSVRPAQCPGPSRAPSAVRRGGQARPERRARPSHGCGDDGNGRRPWRWTWEPAQPEPAPCRRGVARRKSQQAAHRRRYCPTGRVTVPQNVHVCPIPPVGSNDLVPGLSKGTSRHGDPSPRRWDIGRRAARKDDPHVRVLAGVATAEDTRHARPRDLRERRLVGGAPRRARDHHATARRGSRRLAGHRSRRA